MRTVVPTPTSLSMENSSVYFFMLGSPIPAPNPSARMFSGYTVEIYIRGGDSAARVYDHVDLALVHGDGDASDVRRGYAQLFQRALHLFGRRARRGEIVAAYGKLEADAVFTHQAANPAAYNLPAAS